MGKAARVHGLYIAFLTFLAVIWWWPLPVRLTTHVPGTPTWAFDEVSFLWNIWYFQHALLDLGRSPLYTTLIWHPVGMKLVFYTYNFLHVALALPVYWATGNLPLASNVALLVETVAAGYGTFLLVRYVVRRRYTGYPLTAAAALAGLVFAFASNRSVYAAQGHYNMLSSLALPLYALYLWQLLEHPTWRNPRSALMAGLTFAVAAYADSTFAVFLAFLTAIVWLVHPNLSRSTRLASIPVLAGTAGVAAVLWSPLLVPLVREQLSQDYLLQGWGDSLRLSVDLLGFVTPTALHPLWGQPWPQALRAVEEGTARFSDVNTVFLGYATIALALLGAWRGGREARPWVWTAVVFAVLALGPVLQVNGRWQFDMDGIPVTVPMPFALLHYIPFVKGNRVPNRNGVVLMLALAVLVGYAAGWLLTRLRRERWRWALTGLLTLAILGEHAAFPLPLSDMRVPAVYARIAREPGDFTLLQIPLGWRNSFGVFGVERTQVQYYQTLHGKFMLGGNTSRAPRFKMEYFRRIPLFQAIAQVEFGADPPDDVMARAKALAPALMRLYNVRYLILLPPIPGRHPYAETWRKAWQFAKEVIPIDPQPVWVEDGIEVYRVRQPAYPVASVVDLGEPNTQAYLGEGWYDPETIQGRSAVWAGADGTSARIFLRADGSGPYRLTLTALAFTYAGAPPQTLEVWVNGHRVGGPWTLSAQWQDYIADIPAGITRDHTNDVVLRFAWTARPRDVFSGQWEIGRTGVRLPKDVEITAFAGGAYMLTIDDDGTRHDVAFGRRGYNLTLLDPRTGEVIAKTGFDTYANIYESRRMAKFIAQIPEGTIVLVATKGDAARHLTDEAVAALRSLGAAVDLREHPGQYHALVGVKGAAPGTAAEVVAAPSAYIRLGGYPDFRTLGLAVDKVALEPLR